MKSIEPIQIKIIHMALSKLNLSDQVYRDILHVQYKATSCTDLNYHQASNLIDHFKTLGFKVQRSRFNVQGSTRKQRPLPGNVTLLASRDQLDLIDALAGQIAWKYADGFNRWLTKYIKVSRITTAAQAQRAIEGLKGMIKNQKQTEQGVATPCSPGK